MDSDTRRQMQNNSGGLAQLTDGELIDFCQSGNRDAFGALAERHHASVLKIAVSILHDRADAEDEVQNALFKAYEHIGQFQRESKFSTWLTRIVVNQCLMRLRQLRRARLFYLEDAIAGQETMTLDLPDKRLTAEESLGVAQITRMLQLEIRRTPPLLRNVFLLRDVEQRPMPEVADTLGISVAAAKSRLLRARAELKKRMSRHHGTVGPATLMGMN